MNTSMRESMNGVTEVANGITEATYESSNDKRDIDKMFLLLSTIWAGTLGAAIGQSINTHTSWSPFLTGSGLSVNWIISPFNPCDGFCHSKMKTTEKIYRLATYIISTMLGLSIPYLCDRYYSSKDDEFYLLLVTQLGLLFINFLSCFLLQERPSFSEKISWRNMAKRVSRSLFKTGNLSEGDSLSSIPTTLPNDQLMIQRNLRETTDRLKEQNERLASEIQSLENFVKEDPALFQSFKLSFEKSKDFLKLPTMDNSESVPNPLAEEWRREAQKHSYHNRLKAFFLRFLQQHPSFREDFMEALTRQKQNQLLKEIAIEWKS